MTVAGLITILAIVFTVCLGMGVSLAMEKFRQRARKIERAIEDQELRVLKSRANAKQVKELALNKQKEHRVYTELLNDCGEVVNDDYWVDPVAVKHANQVIPPGFQAITTCVVCGEYATHWIEKVDGRDIVRKCIMEKCQGTWTERK